MPAYDCRGSGTGVRDGGWAATWVLESNSSLTTEPLLQPSSQREILTHVFIHLTQLLGVKRSSLERMEKKVHYIYLFAHMYWSTGRHMPQCLCGGQRTTWGSWFSLPTMWVLGMELWFSGLVESASTAETSLLFKTFLRKSLKGTLPILEDGSISSHVSYKWKEGGG